MRADLFGLLVCALVASGCGRDNATSLVDQISEPAFRLNSRGAPSSLTVTYDPVLGASSQPYTVIFFPDREVTEPDLVAAGVDKVLARYIYSEMAYLDGFAGLLVVAQEGEWVQFTTSWKQLDNFQPPKDLVVMRRKTGTADIELRREGGIIRVAAIR